MANKITHTPCLDSLIPVRDALDVLNGKWRILLIISIKAGNNRFSTIQDSIPGITPKVLAKELREMEQHKLIIRTVSNDYPVLISYHLSPYSVSLKPIITALYDWGQSHRKFLFGVQEL